MSKLISEIPIEKETLDAEIERLKRQCNILLEENLDLRIILQRLNYHISDYKGK